MYYKKIKEEYKYNNELIEYLYNNYYYIVDKIYERNDKKIDRESIEYKLKEIITTYVCTADNRINPSKYIHDIMKRFENTYKHKEIKKKEYELISKAYTGDINARKQIFNNNILKIDKKAEEIYIKHNNTQIELDDIKQMMYLDIWIFVNRFYDKENKGCYFSVALMNQLNYLCSFLPDKYKFVLGYLRQGYTYEYAGSMVGLDRQSVNNIKNKIKKISKKNGICWR